MSRRFVYFQGAVKRRLTCVRHYLGTLPSANTIPRNPEPGDFYTHVPTRTLFWWADGHWVRYRWIAFNRDNCDVPSPEEEAMLPTVLESSAAPPECLSHWLSFDFEDNRVPGSLLSPGDLFTNELSGRLYFFTGSQWTLYRWREGGEDVGSTEEPVFDDVDPPPHPPGCEPFYSYIGFGEQPDGSFLPNGFGWVPGCSGGGYGDPDDDPDDPPPDIARPTEPRHFLTVEAANEDPRAGDFRTVNGRLAWYPAGRQSIQWTTYAWDDCP